MGEHHQVHGASRTLHWIVPVQTLDFRFFFSSFIVTIDAEILMNLCPLHATLSLRQRHHTCSVNCHVVADRGFDRKGFAPLALKGTLRACECAQPAC
jgi:hypothetical protein